MKKYLCLWKNTFGEPQTDFIESESVPYAGAILKIDRDGEKYDLKVIRPIHRSAGVVDLRCHRMTEPVDV